MRKFLRVPVICLGLFCAIDEVLYIAFGFRSVDTLLKLVGIEAGVHGIPKWILIIMGVVIIAFLVNYDAIIDYLFGSEDQRK